MQESAQDTKEKQRSTQPDRLGAGGEVLLEGTLELLLLGRGLESTVTKLGRGVDPLEVDLLESAARGVDEHGLAERHDTLLDTRDGALDHDEVVLDLTVADETTKTTHLLVKNSFMLVANTTYGVIFFLVMSISVEAESSAPALPIL